MFVGFRESYFNVDYTLNLTFQLYISLLMSYYMGTLVILADNSYHVLVQSNSGCGGKRKEHNLLYRLEVDSGYTSTPEQKCLTSTFFMA